MGVRVPFVLVESLGDLVVSMAMKGRDVFDLNTQDLLRGSSNLDIESGMESFVGEEGGKGCRRVRGIVVGEFGDGKER